MKPKILLAVTFVCVALVAFAFLRLPVAARYVTSFLAQPPETQKQPPASAGENLISAEPSIKSQAEVLPAPTPTPAMPEPEIKEAQEDYAAAIQIFEPSLPKPVGVIPHGWKMEVVRDQEAQSYPVPLPGARTAEISSLPYEIKPSDRPEFFRLNEPGYSPKIGANSPTIGKLLAEAAAQSSKLSSELEGKLKMIEAALDQSEKDHQERQPKSHVAAEANIKLKPAP